MSRCRTAASGWLRAPNRRSTWFWYGALALALLASQLMFFPGPAAARGLPPPRPAPGTGFTWPASGPITTYFGQVGPTSPRGHAGLDIAAPWGTPVVAAHTGQVVFAGPNGGYGIQATLEHGYELSTLYAHLSQIYVASGEQVERGQVIGLIGSTGYSTGPHLHFEIRQDGTPRDPLGYLP